MPVLAARWRIGAAFVLMVSSSVLAQSPAWVNRTAPLPLASDSSTAYDRLRSRIVLWNGDPSATPTWEWNGSQWDTRSASTTPPPRLSTAMAYDSLRGRVVLFGGWSPAQSTALNDTWEWDGINWLQKLPTVVPPQRLAHAMAFDSARSRAVMFGGRARVADAFVANDTWEWDGLNWLQNTPALAPSSRSGPALAYDSLRGQTVLFGGDLSTHPFLRQPQADTWEWNGATWAQRSPATSPSPRFGAAAAYDSVRGVTVLGDGSSNPGPVWEWNGTSWTQHAAAASPPDTTGDMVFDTANSRTLLVRFGDIWSWNGSSWSHETPARPSRRRETQLAYDDRRGEVVMFGGSDTVQRLADTWEWNGDRWLEHASATAPSARSEHGLAHDSLRDRTVLFGGNSNSSALGDTWEWDGSNWQQLSPPIAPSPRTGHRMVYDRQRHRIVLFGGYDWSTTYFAETWEFDGTTWTIRNPASAPTPRSEHAMAYDRARGRTVVFGGINNFGWTNDTWEFDGTNWAAMSPPTSPSARLGAAMAYDAQRARIVMFGGATGSLPQNDTWEWNGITWQQIAVATSPSARDDHGLVYDDQRGRTTLFGGYVDDIWDYFVPGLAVALEFGVGCGNPVLGAAPTPGSRPVVGQTQHVDIASAPTGVAFMAYGFSNEQFGPALLPVSLATLGMPDCDLLQSMDFIAEPCTSTGPTTAHHAVLVPNVPSIAGLRVFMQPWAPAPGANAAGIVAGNGLALTIGTL